MLLICIISFLSYQRIFFTLGTLIYRWCFRLYCRQKAITWTSVVFFKFCWSWNCGSVDTMYQIRLSDVYICYSSYYHLKTKQNRANRYFSAVLEWLPHWTDDAHVMGMGKGYIYIYLLPHKWPPKSSCLLLKFNSQWIIRPSLHGSVCKNNLQSGKMHLCLKVQWCIFF